MNDQQIYVLCAKRPRIKASEIAEELNTPLIDVSASLRALVDVGDLVRGTAFDDETGRQSQVYELSDAFKSTREGKALLASIGEAPAAAEPAVPNQPQPAPPAMPAVCGSKVERAIAFIRERGQATDGELKTVMDLSKTAHPQAYLQAAIKSGRVRRDGIFWKIGQGPAPAVENVATVGNLVVATRDQSPIPMPVLRHLTAALPDAPAPATTRRCGVWSDGTVELQRDGQQQAQLSREDAEFLADFILGLRKVAA